MDLLSDIDTSFQVSDWPKYFHEFVGLNRSGILRKGRWSIKSEIDNENNADDEEEKSEEGEEEVEEEKSFPICKYFDRWIEGKKLKLKRGPTDSQHPSQEHSQCKWLHNWTIRVLSRKEGSVVLMGQLASSVNPRDIMDINYMAGRVLEVLNPHEIRTRKGEFKLVGSVTNEKREIPSSVIKYFREGIPPSWNDIIRRNWISSAATSSSDESFVSDSVVRRKTQVKSKQPSNALPMKKKRGKLELKSEVELPASSSKEISLSDWTLRRDPVEGFTLYGNAERNSETNAIEAGRILTRIGPKKVKTERGVFTLKGGLTDKDECLPEMIRSKFATSFPSQWKKLLNSCLDTFPIFIRNQDSSDEGNSVNSLDTSVSCESLNAKESQSSRDSSSRKRKFCEIPVLKEIESRVNLLADNSLDESLSHSEEENENKRDKSPIINPSRKRTRTDNEKQKNLKGGSKVKSNIQQKCNKPSKNKVEAIEKKVAKPTRKRPSACTKEKPITKKATKGKSKATNAKKKKDDNLERNKDAEVECEFNISLGDAFTNKNGNASLFSSFISDGVFGSASFKDFSLGKCLLSAKKSRKRQGAETPPLMSMDFDLFKNTTTNSILSANSSISNLGNLKAKQEITKRVKKLNKATPKQSKKSKQNAGKVDTKRNRDVDDLLQQMTSSRKGMSTPILVKKIFRPKTPNSDNDSWESDDN